MYTTVKETAGAIDAAAELAAARRAIATEGWSPSAIATRLPLLVDQVMAEAGVVELRVAARALDQAAGDVSRAVSLVRAWAACLPRLDHCRVNLADLAVERRITPAMREPEGGQYLGASVDYAQRLLDLADPHPATPSVNGNDGTRTSSPGGSDGSAGAVGALPTPFTRAAARLEAEDVVAPPASVARARDRTREALDAGAGRGPFLQALARGETGALTAVAYTAVRGTGDDSPDPTIVELRSGTVPVRVPHGLTGAPVVVGEIAVTMVELALYRAHGDGSDDETASVDARLTMGVGVTVGRLERRAVSAALLDGRVARAAQDPPNTPHSPSDDEEWLLIALDGQEATGFVEHLKLPHHVTFTSELDRIRAVRHRETRLGEET